jgi:methionine-rich copper-binding protein CopC
MLDRLLLRLALAAAFSSVAIAAEAHAFLDHASPANGSAVSRPPEVTLWFTEEVEPTFSGVTVTNAAGDSGGRRQGHRRSAQCAGVACRAETSGARHLPCAMACSVGRHAPDRGQFQLHRGTTLISVSDPLAIVGAVHYAALAQFAGLFVFTSLVVDPPSYPPGWNVSEPTPPIVYDFRPGCRHDYKRYWPECLRCTREEVPTRQNQVIISGGFARPCVTVLGVEPRS